MTVSPHDTPSAEVTSEARPSAAHQLSGTGLGAVAADPPRRATDLVKVAGPLAVFAFFIGFWYFTHHVLMSASKKPLVPVPHAVLQQSFLTWNIERGSDGSRTGGGLVKLLEGLWSSVQVAGLGLAIAILLGFFLATVMSQATWVQNSLWPFLIALQAMPILAFVPLIGTVIGFNFKARVIVCVIIAIFPIVANTLFGLLSVDRGYHELMTLNGASRLTRLFKLQYPAAMPSIFTGLQISAGLSVVGAVVGDFFFRQGEPGLGRLINLYQNSTEYEQMYGAVVMSALLGIIVFVLFGWLGRRIVGHWHETRSS
ncbi:MAG: ABC transporter permease [Ilumatobacter sp.]|uniref:ABC transporter permease n=1 Tax=Ilumatobacter sp. TaxID=1967498 RepID=UPI003C7307C9